MSKLYNKFTSLISDGESPKEITNKNLTFINSLYSVLKLAISALAVLSAIDLYILFDVNTVVYDFLSHHNFTSTSSLFAPPVNIDTAKLGQFGDFFGGVINPILSFLTFFALLVTIVLQKTELNITNEEYKTTTDNINIQALETTLFNLIDLHHKIIDGLKFNSNTFDTPDLIEMQVLAGIAPTPKTEHSITSGRDVFEKILLELKKHGKTPEQTIDQYKSLQNNHNHVLGHYFRNLYQTLKLIDSFPNERISGMEKQKYASILRAQLSSNELALLFLNCLHEIVDNGEFRNLLIRYKMLEHLPINTSTQPYTYACNNLPIATRDIIEQYKLERDISFSSKKESIGAFGCNPNITKN